MSFKHQVNEYFCKQLTITSISTICHLLMLTDYILLLMCILSNTATGKLRQVDHIGLQVNFMLTTMMPHDHSL